MARLSRSARFLAAWVDVVAIAAWGILFLNYWLTNKLNLLIHENYHWLTVATAVALLGVAAWRAITLLQRSRRRTIDPDPSHLTLLPTGWSSTLLLITAMLGLLITPRAFTSQTAIQRGVKDESTLTRVKPQVWRGSSNSEDKSIIDWVRTLTVYPEPNAYKGQKAKIQGFVIQSKDFPSQYLLLSRFVLTCCAADAYPVSLPVKLKHSRERYKQDSWLEVEGQMTTETLGGKRLLVVEAKSIRSIAEPKNPYDN